MIASITYDDDHLTQCWVVMVNEKEVFRANTVMRCHRFICTHHKDGSLPVQEQEEPCTTGNEIMAEIFVECEKFGFDILNDGIYHGDRKLGEVGQTNAGCWWFTRAADETQQRISCESALDAVWWLSMVDTLPHAESADYEELLDRPFEMLTALDWELLREYTPVAASRELVTA